MEQAVGDQQRVMGKVRLADVIKVRSGVNGKGRENTFNRVQSKHLDFVVCNTKGLAVQYVVELDEQSHDRPSQQGRDEFVDKALQAAGVPVFHFSAKRSYSVCQRFGRPYRRGYGHQAIGRSRCNRDWPSSGIIKWEKGGSEVTRRSVWEIREQRIDEIIVNFCIKVVKNPLCYFSEADLQLLLAEELRKYGPLRKWVPTQVRRGAGSKGTYGTPLLHREYGGGQGRRIDIVILKPDEVQQIDNPNLTIKRKYVIPLYAFELGTEKTQNAEMHLKKDLEKLRGASKGYIIHFFKDSTQAKTGSETRTRTEDKINRSFRQAFARRSIPGYENVKILAILVRTGRNQRAIRGKCEIFDGSEWVMANISKGDSLRNAIMNQLR